MSDVQAIQAKDILVPRSDPWTAQRSYFAFPDGSRLIFLLRGAEGISDDESELVLEEVDLDNFFWVSANSQEQREQLEVLDSIVGGLLETDQLSLDDVRSTLQKESKFEEPLIDGYLRLRLADRKLEATEKKGRTTLRLSTDAREQEKLRAYAAAFAHELVTQSEQLGRLIGHAPTIGGQREELLRVLIQKHIPQRFHVATGFIVGIPNQLDILIYDQIEYAPLFRTGDLVVIPNEAVRAIIEVKSTLTTSELRDALKHLSESRPIRSGPPVFTGIFAYDGARAKTLARAIRKFHDADVTTSDGNETDSPDTSQTTDNAQTPTLADFPEVIGDIDDPITAVCVLKHTMLASTFHDREIDGVKLPAPAMSQLKTFSKRSAEAALFFDLLSRFLRHPVEGARVDDGMSPLLIRDIDSCHLEWLTEGNWGPYLLNDDDAERFEARLGAYREWLDGGAWNPKHTYTSESLQIDVPGPKKLEYVEGDKLDGNSQKV